MIYLSEKMGRFILFVLGTAFFAPFSFICILCLFTNWFGIILWLVSLFFALRAYYRFLKMLS